MRHALLTPGRSMTLAAGRGAAQPRACTGPVEASSAASASSRPRSRESWRWMPSLRIFSTSVVRPIQRRFAACATTPKAPDPLPSWNEGPSKTAILEFVELVRGLGPSLRAAWDGLDERVLDIGIQATFVEETS